MHHALASAIAAGLLLCATTPATAQSSVTVYGVVDAALQYANADATATAAADGRSGVSVISGGQGSSRFRVRGIEDIGGGLSAIFELEHRFFVDTGEISGPAAETSGNRTFWNAQAYVGLAGGWGRLTAGRQYVPLYDVLLPLDTTGNTFYNNWSAYQNNRLSNAVGYRTPSLRGFTGSAMWAAGEGLAAGQRSGDSYGTALQWVTGPLVLVGGYMRYGQRDAGSADREEWGAGVAYRSGPRTQIGGAYLFTNLATGNDVSQYLLSGSVGLLSGTLYVNYIRVEPDGGTRSDRLGVAYSMPLSGRTNVYVTTGMDSDVQVGTRLVDPMRVAVGMRHLF
ncbi:MAG: porin [Burkholderiales bacterium]